MLRVLGAIGRIVNAIDLWCAKRLFFPVIVRICQAAKCDQYAFAAYAMVVALLAWVPVIMTYGLLGKVINFGVTILCLVFIGLSGRISIRPRRFWRVFAWTTVILNTTSWLDGSDPMDKWRVLSWFFMLWHEYALMIDRIPPLESEERAQVRAAEALS